MEESKSVPGARKVRKMSSGGRSGRSSRKSSLSSVASLTDNEIPETSEPKETDNDSGSPKKGLPNGTHSDEDRVPSKEEQTTEKPVESVVNTEESKKGDDVEQTSNKKRKVDTLQAVEETSEKTVDTKEAPTETKITKQEQDNNKNSQESNLKKNKEDKEEVEKKKDKSESKAESKGEKIKSNNESGRVRKKSTSREDRQIQKTSKEVKVGETKDKKKDNETVSKDKVKKGNDSKKLKKEPEKGKFESKSSKKPENLTESNKKSEESKSKSEHKKDSDRHGKKRSGSEVKAKSRKEDDNNEGVEKISNVDARESYCSSEAETSAKCDESDNVSDDGLDFVGFETPSYEKSTMFFRILDDIRIDDSVMQDIADGDESDKRDEDINTENMIVEDDKTDPEDDYNGHEDIFIPEVVCVPVSDGRIFQFSKDDILSTTSSTPSLSSVKSSSSRKRARDKSAVKKPPIDLSNPLFLKPFEYGWKRELVFRAAVSDVNSKRNADIYYYTPKGKKVRSTREVTENLTDPELTIDNFTFFKEPIGLNDPEKEIIREAKIRGDRDHSATPPPAKKSNSSKSTESKSTKSVTQVQSPPTSDGNKLEESSPPKGGTPSSFSSMPKIVLKSSMKNSSKSKTPSKPSTPHQSSKSGSSKDKKSSQDSDEELEMGMLPPLWPTPPERGTAREIASTTKVSGSKTIEVCSIRCPLAMGLIPTLQCHLCLCLYHPECVGLEEAMNRTIHSYVCKNCQEAKKGGGMSSTGMNKATPPVLNAPPPLTPISSLGSNSNTGQSSPSSLPKLQRLGDAKLPMTSKSQKIVGGVTTWLPPSSMIQLTSKNTPLKTSAPTLAAVETPPAPGSMPAQTLMSMNGKRYVVVPKHNVLSVSPATTTTSGTSVADPPSPVSTFALSNPQGNETAVSTSNVPNAVLVTAPNPALSTVSIITTSLPANRNNNVPILPKPLPGTNAGDASCAYMLNNPPTPTNPPGVLLVPCVTTTATSNTKEGSKFVIVNGPAGLATGNFVIGNIPPQQQLQLPAIPTTQPAVPSNELSGGVKRLHDENDKSPPAKRSKKESPAKKEASSPSSIPKAALVPVSPSTTPPPEETTPPVETKNTCSSLNKDYFMTNMSAVYKALLHSFQYLKVQELLRASRVCHLWRDIASHKSLWQTVRMKNSRVRDWDGFANMLRNSGTKHLDLRKMLVPDKQENLGDMWLEYAHAMECVNMLLRIDMCRCPGTAVENSVKNNNELQVLSALSISRSSSSLNLAAFENCKNLTELRLKSSEKGGMTLTSLESLKSLTKIKHLSLLTVKDMSASLSEVLECLVNLESLELGECLTLSGSVVTDGLSKLHKLQRLRLEKGHGINCPTIPVLNTISNLTALTQLELINFDIKPGFDTALANCKNLRTLLIIPTYVTQSATTNHVVMEGVSKLSKTLMHFVWGITLELLKVTDLFIDQWEGQKVKSSSSGTPKKGGGDSIPILKPLTEENSKEGIGGAPSQVDILQLPKLHKVLTALLPTTKIKILKVPYSATWRQTVTGPTNIH